MLLSKVDRLLSKVDRLVQLKNPDSNNKSAIARGDQILGLVRLKPNQFVGFPGEQSRALFTLTTLQILQDCLQLKNENQVVAVALPTIAELMQTVHPSCRVSSSEDFQWLNSRNDEFEACYCRKPDLNAAHSAVVTRKTFKRELGVIPEGLDSWPDSFGVLHPSGHLRRFIHFLLQAKPSSGIINGEVFGQLLIDYEFARMPMCGIAINRDHWGIYRFDHTEDENELPVVAYGEGRHDAPGSFEFISTFLSRHPCPYTEALNSLATMLECTFLPDSGPIAAGRDGVLLHVHDKDSVDRALKITFDQDGREVLVQELAAHKQLFLHEHLDVISPLSSVVESEGTLICALLFEHVAQPLHECLRNMQRPTLMVLQGCLKSLSQVHLKNLAHGDPRLANFVLHKERYVLVDWARALDTSSPERDVRILVESILGDGKDRVDEQVIVYLSDYNQHQELALAIFNISKRPSSAR